MLSKELLTKDFRSFLEMLTRVKLSSNVIEYIK